MRVPRVLAPGDRLAGYTIEACIGRGGMGTVYVATKKYLWGKAAIKVISYELAADESFRERFVREAQVLSSLQHPNVIPIKDADEADGLLFIVMPYIEPPDL